MAEVIAAPSPHDGGQYFSSSQLLQSSHSQSPFFHDRTNHSISPPLSESANLPSHLALRPSQPQTELLRRSTSYSSVPTESLVKTHASNDIDDDDDRDDDSLLSYNEPTPITTLDRDDDLVYAHDPDLVPVSNAPTPDNTTPVDDNEGRANLVADDIDARQEPSRQVDYLSHEWKEEDIWSSWRHIVTRRKHYGEQSRLENASWRTWAKQKYRLRTISPETLNWLKDCDVTWLYGPLQEAPRNRRNSEPVNQLSKSASFLNKKPILKKRSVSEEMLQRSLSSSSLVKQAAAAVQAQRNGGAKVQPRPTPRLRRCASDFDGISTYTGSTATANISSTLPSSTSSGAISPDISGRKRIRFDKNVEQCIAVDFKEGGFEDEANPQWLRACSDEESDDELPIIKTKPRKRAARSDSSRTSFSSEGKGIAKLPSTTIKFHHEELHCRGHLALQFKPLRSPALSPPPSQETLKPSKESVQFYSNDTGHEEGEWLTSRSATSDRKDGSSRPRTETALLTEGPEDSGVKVQGMHRSSNSVSVPFEEGEDDNMMPAGVLGRIVDTVNTARDICYVLYNVGWRK